MRERERGGEGGGGGGVGALNNKNCREMDTKGQRVE